MPDTALPLDWRADALQGALAPLWPGVRVEVQPELASTNTTLLERARAGDAAPTLLVAEAQSGGRGRQGRAWVARSGASLTFSLGLPLALADWSGLSLAVGCAMADALDPATRLQLKWPNDIWLDGRKLGGILIETVPAQDQRYAVIGVGLNIAAIDADPAQFQTGFAALQELHPNITAPRALERIAPALLRMLQDFGHQGFAAWQPAYARRDLTLGRRITAGALDGVSRGVNAGGELMLQTPAGMQAVGSGEVSVRLEP
jgi:BirA family biotin operon repressor/biotin-[acetyl-CoA-carboxylase] ligase